MGTTKKCFARQKIWILCMEFYEWAIFKIFRIFLTMLKIRWIYIPKSTELLFTNNYNAKQFVYYLFVSYATSGVQNIINLILFGVLSWYGLTSALYLQNIVGTNVLLNQVSARSNCVSKWCISYFRKNSILPFHSCYKP